MFFSFLKKFRFSGSVGDKRAKNTPEWQKIMSAALLISGTIHHMIVIYGANVWNDNISRCFFNFKILIFWVNRGLKGQKMAQNDKKFCLSHLMFQQPYIIWSYDLHLWYTCMYKMIISRHFLFFSKFWFTGLLEAGGWGGG